MTKSENRSLMDPRKLRAGISPHPSPVRLSLILLGLLLFGYTVLRAVSVSFSWDESWTYVHHVSKDVFYQTTFNDMGANFHLLNVWLMWFSSKIFGDGQLALRLPNLAAQLLYLYATGRIALKAHSGFLAVAVFVLLNVHPYLLDFFSLARGYGLACGWMMVALWHVWRYCEEGRRADQVLWTAVYGSLAVLSNLIMVNFLLAAGLVFLIDWTWQARRTGLRAWWKHFLMLSIPSVIALLVVIPQALGLRSGGSLYFGCDTFWPCMLRSLGAKVLYHQPYATPVLTIMALAIAVVALFSILTIAAAIRAKRPPPRAEQPLLFGILVLCGCLLSFFLQQKLFDTPLPQSRTALFLLPLMAFILVAALIGYRGRSWIPSIVGGLLCLPLIVHQYNSFNLKYAVEWKPFGEVAHMLDVIAKDHLPLSESRPIVTLCSSFEGWGSIPYYQRTRDMEWLVTTVRRPPDPYVNSDYYIVEYDGYERVDTVHWKMLYRSDATNTTLYRDKRWRDPEPEVLFRERHDMEDPGLTGGTAVQRSSGTRSILFDETVRSTAAIKWVMPEGHDSLQLQLTGSGMVLQPDDTNWIALLISVKRDGKEIAHADVSSALQTVHFGEWNRVGISLRPTVALRPNDVVELSVWPLTADTPLYLDDLELNVLR